MTIGKNVPFRKWYGCLGEIRSLIPEKCQIIILTATATTETKEQIASSLQLNFNDLQLIEMSPDRGNLLYAAKYLDKNDPIEMAFPSPISKLKATPRTIIYCQTIKQRSIVYRIFEANLGKDMYHEQPIPQNRMVEMYHAGTTKSVKDHVLQNMTKDTGDIRVLICTIAFSMGVNCKSMRRIVHFGPSKSVEQYVQECGRAGRDGLASVCVLL